MTCSPIKDLGSSYHPENTRSLNTGNRWPLAPRTVGGLPFTPAAFSDCCHSLSLSESTEHLSTDDPILNYSNEMFFLLTSTYRDQSCFLHDRETRVVIRVGAKHWQCRFNGAPNNGVYCVLDSIFWMRQHLTVWLAVMNTGYCGKATKMQTVTR